MNRFRSFIEESLLGIYIVQNDKIIHVNKRMAEIYALSRYELQSWDMNRFITQIHIDDREIFTSFFSKLGLHEDSSNILMFRIHNSKNEIRWIRQISNVYELQDELLIQSVFIDITEQKRLSEKVVESEKKHQRIFEGASDLIINIDMNGVMTSVNPACYKLLGYEENEMTGKPFMNFIHKGYVDDATERWKRFLSSALPGKVYEYGVLKKNKTPVTIEVSSSLIYEENELTGVQSIARDITERKRLEKQTLHTQKLEAIALLAGGIAHDYNNILVSILGNINLLQINPTDEEKIKLLDDLEKATLRASNLTNQLLTFAKGGAPIRNPTSIIELTKESASFALLGSKCDFEIQYINDLPMVEIDAGQIHRVLNNILINSVQAMPDGGTIKININEQSIIDIDDLPLQLGTYLRIEIHDSGIGIPDEDQDRVFEPYFSTKKDGSGLGLATSYSIIMKHGGHITFSSRKNEGTTFFIYLPVATAKISSYEIEEDEEAIPTSGHILIMDDNIEVQTVLSKMLKKFGFQVECAVDGKEAIEKYQASLIKNKFDLIIMDLTVSGGMGGKEAMKQIYNLDPNVKAIVSSGYSQDLTMSNYKDHHFQGILTKPYTIGQLKKSIGKVLQTPKND
jgi:PAS domain S-box-containing protein